MNSETQAREEMIKAQIIAEAREISKAQEFGSRQTAHDAVISALLRGLVRATSRIERAEARISAIEEALEVAIVK